MKIKRYDSFKEVQVDIKIDSEDLPIFFHPKYASMINATKGWITSWYVGYHDGKAVCLLPMATKKGFFYTKGMCLFSTYSINNTFFSEQTFLDEFIKFVRENKICDWIQQGQNWAFFNCVPKGATFCDFGTYRVDLKKQEEVMKREGRRYIDRAKDSCVLIKEDLTKAYSVISSTLHNAHLSELSLCQLEKEKIILGDSMMSYVADYDGVSQAAVVAYRTNHSLYAIYAGSILKPFNGATNWIYSEMYNMGRQNGAHYFDFVGAIKNPDPNSKFYRIQQFKRHMGGEEVWGYLWRYVFSKKKYFLYSTLLKLYSRFKHRRYGDIIYLETGK
jgi:hypothetical protein